MAWRQLVLLQDDEWFTVKVTTRDWPAPGGPQPITEWEVELPHQCDEWTITAAATKEQAIRELEQFLTKAQAALDVLRASDTPEWSLP